ncbi:hypothetical protein Jiend_51450 [Micromonospora endophytica]|nr:hypothetical protein Jiend_51450 [Micromonospora endophytica]
MGSLGLQAALAHALRADQRNAGGSAPVGRRGDAPQLCVPASEDISDAIPDGYLGGFHRSTVLLTAIERLSFSHHPKGRTVAARSRRGPEYRSRSLRI